MYGPSKRGPKSTFLGSQNDPKSTKIDHFGGPRGVPGAVQVDPPFWPMFLEVLLEAEILTNSEFLEPTTWGDPPWDPKKVDFGGFWPFWGLGVKNGSKMTTFSKGFGGGSFSMVVGLRVWPLGKMCVLVCVCVYVSLPY